MRFSNIFLNRHADVRIGWRLLLFVLLVLTLVWGDRVLLLAVGLPNDFAITALALASVLLVSYLLTRFLNRKPFGAIGLSLHSLAGRELGIGCFLGFLMMTGVFLVEEMSGFAQLSWRGLGTLESVKIVAWGIPYFAVAALFEETLFRGYFFQTLMQGITFLPAMLVMSLLFGLGHLLNPNATTFGVVNVALAGILFSIAYLKTRSLWLPFGLHFAWNFSESVLYAFPNSGVPFREFKMFDLVQLGPDWITGGAFGPEGGILGSLALVLGTWYILKSKYIRTPEGLITLDSVEDILPDPIATENHST